MGRMRYLGRRIGLRGHRGRRIRRPTAQSGRRSSAQGLLCPLSAWCVQAAWRSRTRNARFGVRDRIRKGKCVLTPEKSRVRTHFYSCTGCRCRSQLFRLDSGLGLRLFRLDVGVDGGGGFATGSHG